MYLTVSYHTPSQNIRVPDEDERISCLIRDTDTGVNPARIALALVAREHRPRCT